MWEDETIKFSGVPFVVLSFKTFECHHGVDRNTKDTKKTIQRKRYKESKEKKKVSETKDLVLYSSS